MDIRTFFARPTAVKTMTETKTKTAETKIAEMETKIAENEEAIRMLDAEAENNIWRGLASKDEEEEEEEFDEMEDAITTCEACGYKGDSVVVHSWGCVALCEDCSMEDGEPHCPRKHRDEPCEWCVQEWRRIDGKEEDEEEGHTEECEGCQEWLGGRNDWTEEEFDEHPDREAGYDPEDGAWYCPDCRPADGNWEDWEGPPGA